MNPHSRVTITVVASLFTLLFSTVCSAAGIYAIGDHGVILDVHPAAGFLMISCGIAAWIGPPILWVLPGRSSNESSHRPDA